MPNLLFISDQDIFREDFQKQIELYAPEFCFDFADNRPDVAIIDQAPEKTFQLQKNFPHIPMFVLLKNGEEKPQNTPLVKYLNKPLSLYGFINDLRASINLANLSSAGNLRFNDYELRPLSKEIYSFKRQEAIKLTEKEVAIIQYLYKTDSRNVTKNELLQEVWCYNPDVTTHTIETHIYRLRQKVEHNGADEPFIVTEEGGYQLKK